MTKGHKRVIYLAIGWFFTGLAFLGIFLPVLPTTPFLLVAVWAYGRSSERLKQWLYNHPKFGVYIRDWFQDGAINRKGKIMSFSLMALSFAYLVYKGMNLYILAGVGVTMLCVAAYVLSRPEPKRAEEE